MVVNTIDRKPLAWLAAALAALSLAVILASNAGAVLLTAALESRAVPLASRFATNAQAIVVLGGGPGREERAAQLQRETGLPLLASGVEAVAMKRKITREWAVPVQWMEENSRTAEENAEFSAKILKQNGVHRILLVTNALHMLRAQTLFSHQGFDVIAAPVAPITHAPLSKFRLSDFVPSSEGWQRSRPARHELMGLAWLWAGRIIRAVIYP